MAAASMPASPKARCTGHGACDPPPMDPVVTRLRHVLRYAAGVRVRSARFASSRASVTSQRTKYRCRLLTLGAVAAASTHPLPRSPRSTLQVPFQHFALVHDSGYHDGFGWVDREDNGMARASNRPRPVTRGLLNLTASSDYRRSISRRVPRRTSPALLYRPERTSSPMKGFLMLGAYDIARRHGSDLKLSRLRAWHSMPMNSSRGRGPFGGCSGQRVQGALEGPGALAPLNRRSPVACDASMRPSLGMYGVMPYISLLHNCSRRVRRWASRHD